MHAIDNPRAVKAGPGDRVAGSAPAVRKRRQHGAHQGPDRLCEGDGARGAGASGQKSPAGEGAAHF